LRPCAFAVWHLNALYFKDYHFFHYITLTNLIDHLKTFVNFPEDGMVAVEVFGVFAAVADEELGASGVSAGVGHGENATVVVLITAVQLALDLVARTSVTNTVRTAALDHKIRYDAVENKAVVKIMLGEVGKVLHGLGGIFFKEFDFHDALFGMDFCDLHGNLILGCKSNIND
jgi:hypothetical protein